jgi:hypothetical protein
LDGDDCHYSNTRTAAILAVRPNIPAALLERNGSHDRRVVPVTTGRLVFVIKDYLMTIGWTECLIILLLVIFIAGLTFRFGFLRGRRRD